MVPCRFSLSYIKEFIYWRLLLHKLSIIRTFYHKEVNRNLHLNMIIFGKDRVHICFKDPTTKGLIVNKLTLTKKNNTYLLLLAMDWKIKPVSWFKMGIYWIAHWLIFDWLTSFCFDSFTFSPKILNAAFHDSSKNSINSLREIWLSSSLSNALNVSINSITIFYIIFSGFYHSEVN